MFNSLRESTLNIQVLPLTIVTSRDTYRWLEWLDFINNAGNFLLLWMKSILYGVDMICFLKIWWDFVNLASTVYDAITAIQQKKESFSLFFFPLCFSFFFSLSFFAHLITEGKEYF